MSTPPRYFLSVMLALSSLFAFLIPIILVVYVGHAFFFGPAWLASQPGTVQIVVECFMAFLGGFGLLVQWLCFWFFGFIFSARAQYEWRYTRYIRQGHDPNDWARLSLS